MRSRPHVALVTTGRMPEGAVDTELPLIHDQLTGQAEVRVVSWDDPAMDWSTVDLAVIRSTWDYPARLAEFLDWVTHCADRTRLANPPEVIRWNCDKRYLGALRESGVPVTPTSYLPPGTAPVIPGDIVPGDLEFVVKPSVGVNAWRVGRYRPDDRAAASTHIERLHAAGSTVLIQPFLSRVDIDGERSLVFIDGEFRYATRKGAVLVPGVDPEELRDAHPGVRPWRPTPAELAVADAALAAVPGPGRLLYARVDLINDDTGAPLVSELELIEPSLFVDVHPASLDALCAAIVRAATTDD